MIKIIKFSVFLFALLLLQNTNARADSKTFVVAQRTFQVPQSWKAEQPSSRMRKAQFKAKKTEIVVFYCGAGSGGSADANVSRWLGQFKEPKEELSSKIEKKKIKSNTITTVSAKGTYRVDLLLGRKRQCLTMP